MNKFRKKPIAIEAVQITDATFDAPHPNDEHIEGVIYNPVSRTVHIPTLEGTMAGLVGDWIIRGVNGELYPCKDEIFRKTYEPVEGTPLPTEYENGYVAGYEEHRRTVIAAMRNQEAVDSIGDFLQARLQDEYDLHLGNDHALDMAGDLLFALVTAIRLEEPNHD